MNALVERIKESEITSIFTPAHLYNFGLDKVEVDEMLREAVVKYDIVHIKDDIYTLGKSLRKEFITDEVLAQKLVPDSYVSREFVLSQISWIPEGVFIVTCVTSGQDQKIDTEYGRYRYVNLHQKNYMAGVRKYTEGFNSYYKATPLKALADMICEREYYWTTLEPLYESLRIEDWDLETLTGADFDELHGSYGIPFVEDFLYGIRKELSV